MDISDSLVMNDTEGSKRDTKVMKMTNGDVNT